MPSITITDDTAANNLITDNGQHNATKMAGFLPAPFNGVLAILLNDEMLTWYVRKQEMCVCVSSTTRCSPGTQASQKRDR